MSNEQMQAELVEVEKRVKVFATKKDLNRLVKLRKALGVKAYPVK